MMVRIQSMLEGLHTAYSNVSSPARELNPATLSTRLRAGPSVRGVESIASDAKLRMRFTTGIAKTPPK